LGFVSRTLNEAEQRYHTTELELLAIVFGCKKFRNYILGYPINVLTDHQALAFLHKYQLLNGRLTRWSIILQEYNLTIIHIPGKENVGADTLTRYPQQPDECERVKHINLTLNRLMLIDYSDDLQEQFSRFRELQQQDPKLRNLIHQITKKPHERFLTHKGILFSVERNNKYRAMVPSVMNQQLIKKPHEHFGHAGTYKTYEVLRHNYQLKNMYRIIKCIVKSCDLCQRSKINNQLSRGPTLSNIPEGPRHTVSLDLMGPLSKGQFGAKYILAIIDIFSKYIKLYALRRATTETILKRITKDYIPRYGLVKQILTDNCIQFNNAKWYEQLNV